MILLQADSGWWVVSDRMVMWEIPKWRVRDCSDVRLNKSLSYTKRKTILALNCLSGASLGLALVKSVRYDEWMSLLVLLCQSPYVLVTSGESELAKLEGESTAAAAGSPGPLIGQILWKLVLSLDGRTLPSPVVIAFCNQKSGNFKLENFMKY